MLPVLILSNFLLKYFVENTNFLIRLIVTYLYMKKNHIAFIKEHNMVSNIITSDVSSLYEPILSYSPQKRRGVQLHPPGLGLEPSRYAAACACNLSE